MSYIMGRIIEDICEDARAIEWAVGELLKIGGRLYNAQGGVGSPPEAFLEVARRLGEIACVATSSEIYQLIESNMTEEERERKRQRSIENATPLSDEEFLKTLEDMKEP